MFEMIWMKDILKNTELLCIVVGALLALKYLTSLFLLIIKIFLKRPKNLAKRYGEGSWVLVTGSSDGIGKAFCFAFAARGFNVCLVARNEEKLKNVAQEIKKAHPKVETKIVVADFVHSCEENFFNKIMAQIDGLDISILVNNVGIGHSHRFTSFTENQLQEMIVINMVPMALLTRKLINKLSNRAHKSAVINVSSGSAIAPLPYMATYGGSKRFNKFFSLSLDSEFRNKNVDMFCLMPFFVDTPMTVNNKRKKITPEACVEGCLQDLGNTNLNYGALKHKLQGWGFSLFASLPKPIWEFCISSVFK